MIKMLALRGASIEREFGGETTAGTILVAFPFKSSLFNLSCVQYEVFRAVYS